MYSLVRSRAVGGMQNNLVTVSMLWKLGKLSFVRSLIPFFIATLSFPSVFMQSKEVSHIILLNKRKKMQIALLKRYRR